MLNKYLYQFYAKLLRLNSHHPPLRMILAPIKVVVCAPSLIFARLCVLVRAPLPICALYMRFSVFPNSNVPFYVDLFVLVSLHCRFYVTLSLIASQIFTFMGACLCSHPKFSLYVLVCDPCFISYQHFYVYKSVLLTFY